MPMQYYGLFSIVILNLKISRLQIALQERLICSYAKYQIHYKALHFGQKSMGVLAHGFVSAHMHTLVVAQRALGLSTLVNYHSYTMSVVDIRYLVKHLVSFIFIFIPHYIIIIANQLFFATSYEPTCHQLTSVA